MSIGVYARVRPIPGLDDSGIVIDKRAEQRQIQVKHLEFSLDRIFDTQATQSELYNAIGKERVPRVLAGENCCFLCYGQTGSGKTHTMFGPSEVVADWSSAPAEQGLAPRAISQLFESVSASGSTCSVQCQYVEVYNDTVNDLLGGKKALPLREAARGVVVEGLASAEVGSLEDAMRQLQRGNASRVVAKMKMNSRSSRGHALFTLSLQSRSGDRVASGKLVLVDLAGMESSKKSYSVEGESSKPQRREEARHINTSLFALGSVVERLSTAKGGGAGHVPFRNSKLTRLLQDSLGGSSACAVVVTLRAEKENLDECVSTLRFAQRAAGVPVVVKSTVATAAPDPVALVKELRGATEELSEAKALIEQLQRERGALQRAAAAEAAAAAAEAEARRELTEKEDALDVARLQIEQLHAKMAEMMEDAAAGGAAARKQLEAEHEANGRPSLGASMRASRRAQPERQPPPQPAAAAAAPQAGRAGRAAGRLRGEYFDSSAHEAALDDYLERSSPALQRLSRSQANQPAACDAPTKIEALLDEDALAEKLDLGRSLRPGQVPLELVSAQLDALADAEEDIEADLAELDVIDLASESPILSDAARRVMQFAQLSKFMTAGIAPQLSATHRSARGDTIETADFSIEDRRVGGTVDFSIGDLHRLVLELPSVPVEKLRRELDLIGDAARATHEEEDCLGRTMVKSRSAAVVAAARGRR